MSLISSHFSEVLILQKKILLSLASERSCKRSFTTVYTTSITYLCIRWHLFPCQFRELFKPKKLVIQPLKEKNPGLPVTTQIKICHYHGPSVGKTFFFLCPTGREENLLYEVHTVSIQEDSRDCLPFVF